jgi:hypothetical protein
MSSEGQTTWWERRLQDLAEQIAAGRYSVPAEDVAAAILFGRPKWGDDPVGVPFDEKAEAPARGVDRSLL